MLCLKDYYQLYCYSTVVIIDTVLNNPKIFSSNCDFSFCGPQFTFFFFFKSVKYHHDT